MALLGCTASAPGRMGADTEGGVRRPLQLPSRPQPLSMSPLLPKRVGQSRPAATPSAAHPLGPPSNTDPERETEAALTGGFQASRPHGAQTCPRQTHPGNTQVSTAARPQGSTEKRSSTWKRLAPEPSRRPNRPEREQWSAPSPSAKAQGRFSQRTLPARLPFEKPPQH